MTKTLALLCALMALGASRAYAQGSPVRRAANPVPNQYIVVLAPGEDPLSVGLQSQAIHRGRLDQVYEHAVHGFAMRLTPAAAAALARDPRVRYVEEDGVVHAIDTQTYAPWNLDRIDQRNRPIDGQYNYPTPGQTVYAHIIDSGIRATHQEFTGRAFVVADFVDDDLDGNPDDVGNDDGNPAEQDGADCNGHGTHVAGTIGGDIFGVAKNVTLLAYRVLNCNGDGTSSAVIAAIDRITADPRRPAVANMSLSGGPSNSLDAALRNSIASGVTYVVSAGNDNANAGLGSPSRVTEAITVAATNFSDVRASFSNFGAVVDLFAPGVSIRSAYHTSDTGTAVLSGTSMSSPLVAGVVAIYLQAMGSQTPAQVQAALIDNATLSLVVDPAGSPNRLLNSEFLLAAPPPPLPWTFTASPSTIETGQSSVLSFTTTTADVDNVFIDGQSPTYSCDGSSCSGTLTVSPSATTTYTLTSTNSTGTVYPALSVTVTVTEPPVTEPPVPEPPVTPPPVPEPPVTEPPVPEPPAPTPPEWSFSASPAEIQAGQSTVLWFTTTTANLHNVFIDAQRPTYSCDASSCFGTLTVTPSATTTYTLSSIDSADTPYPTLSVTVTVNPGP